MHIDTHTKMHSDSKALVQMGQRKVEKFPISEVLLVLNLKEGSRG